MGFKSFFLKHRIQIFLLSFLLYVPLFMYLVDGRDSNDLIQSFALILLSPIFLMSGTVFFGLFIHVVNLLITLTTSFFVIYLWYRYIVQHRILKRFIVVVIVIFLIYKWAGFHYGFELSIPPHKCDFQLGYTSSGDQITSKRQMCLADFAFKSKNSNDCFVLGEGAYQCLRFKAKEQNDSSICLKVKKQWQQSLCLEEYRSNAEGY